MSFKCPKCENEYDNIISLSKHWSRTHKEETKTLYMYINNLTSSPTCGCGCGQEVKFLDAGRGFSEYVWGHKARVANNFNTEKSKTNSLQTRKKMLEEGTWKPFHEKESGEHWSKGKTAETDARIAKGRNSIISNPEELKRRSVRMKENRLNGTIPTLTHSQWKGGISSLNHTCMSNPKLYKEWIYPKLASKQFKCELCSSSQNIEVHHDQETFSAIYNRFAEEYRYSLKLTTSISPETDPEIYMLKMMISDAVAEYHIDNNVSGKVLCEVCHKEQH